LGEAEAVLRDQPCMPHPHIDREPTPTDGGGREHGPRRGRRGL